MRRRARLAVEPGRGRWTCATPRRIARSPRRPAERGRLVVWVNNAGVLRTEKAWEHSDADVRLIIETNVLGVMWGSRAAIETMRTSATGDEHVLNLSSMSAFGPVPGLAVYASSKHAVLGFTTSLQGDLHLGRASDPRACAVSGRRRHADGAGARRRPRRGDHLVGLAAAHRPGGRRARDGAARLTPDRACAAPPSRRARARTRSRTGRRREAGRAVASAR